MAKTRVNTVGRTLGLFRPRERRRLLLVFASVVFVAILEVVGIASVMPFLALVSNPDTIHTNLYLQLAWELGGFTSERVFLMVVGLLVFTLVVATNVFTMASLWLMQRFTWDQNHSLSKRLLGRYLRQPWEYFLVRNTSDMGTQILAEVQSFTSGFLHPMMTLCAQSIVTSMIILLLFFVDPLLAILVTLVVGGAYTVLYAVVRGHLRRNGEIRKTAMKERYLVANEALSGMKDLKARGLEGYFTDLFAIPSRRLSRVQAFQAIISTIPKNGFEIIAFGALLSILLYQMAVRDDISQVVPTVGLYAFAGYRLMPKAMGIYKSLTKLRYHHYLLTSLERDLGTLAASEEPLGTRGIPTLSEALELDGVSYAYPASTQLALDGVSLSIPAKASIAIVGTTGSGKTTTVDVVLGLLEPTSGRIVLDGKPLERRELIAWRRNCGYVPQQIFLTDDTVAANIAFGVASKDIDRGAVERAARIANIHDFIVAEMPEQYNTIVGDRGVRLSGGQRQRIGIARALYHDPEVLVFDEATSALDTVTERAIMEAIETLAGSKTIVMIAHRLATVRDCDCIYLLDHGKLVASGTFQNLLASSSAFRAMADHDEERPPHEN